MSHDSSTAARAMRLTATPDPPRSRPSAWLATLSNACPNMIASTADQAAASSADMTTISTRAPPAPNTLRSATNCSIP
jgi:hypothetical protein